jgi:hypothetical protein
VVLITTGVLLADVITAAIIVAVMAVVTAVVEAEITIAITAPVQHHPCASNLSIAIAATFAFAVMPGRFMKSTKL